MIAALVVNPVTSDIPGHLAAVLAMAHQAADAHAQCVLFPEAAITGLINHDDPAHDLPLGQPIPGPFSQALGGLSTTPGYSGRTGPGKSV